MNLEKLYQLYNQGDFENIIKFGEKSLQIESDNINLLNIIGLAYDQIALNAPNKRKEYQKQALIYFKKLILLDKNSTQGWKGSGLVYLHQNKLKKSLDCYKRIYALNKKDFSSFISCANVYRAMKKYKLAERWYKKSFKTDINDFKLTSLFNLATMFNDNNQDKLARRYAQQALHIINLKVKPLSGWVKLFQIKMEKIISSKK